MSAREIIAAGLHRSGALSVLERVARSYEFRLESNSRRPRWSRAASGKFAILCYHRVGTGGIPYYSELATAEFEKQMRFLRRHYRILSLEQLVREISDPKSKSQGVAVTFDDGYRGLYTEALPILTSYQIPATVYLIGAAMETGEPAWYDKIFLAMQVFPKESFEIQLATPRKFALDSRPSRISAAIEIVTHLRTVPDAQRRARCIEIEHQVALPADALAERMLNWTQVREMQKAGISFGAHTMTHPVLSRLPLPEAERELRDSKQLIENHLQTPALDFAYPFGHAWDCSADVEHLAARVGFRSAVTTTWGVNRTGANPFALRRPQIGQDGSLSMFAFQMNQLFLRNEEPLGVDPALHQNSALSTASESSALAGEVKQDA